MPIWPASLPQFAMIGAKIGADDSVLRSNMDAGPPVRRNRFTAITKSVSYTFRLTGTQVETLDNFFHSTLRNGALSFDWTDPRTDATVLMAFLSPPEYTAILGNPKSLNRCWSALLSLEIQP